MCQKVIRICCERRIRIEASMCAQMLFKMCVFDQTMGEWSYFMMASQLQAGSYAYLDHKHLFQFPARARSKQLCQCRIRNCFFGRRLRMEGIPALQLWGCVLETCSQSGAKVASVIHHVTPLMTCRLIWLTTFQASIQSVHSQPAHFLRTAKQSCV